VLTTKPYPGTSYEYNRADFGRYKESTCNTCRVTGKRTEWAEVKVTERYWMMIDICVTGETKENRKEPKTLFLTACCNNRVLQQGKETEAGAVVLLQTYTSVSSTSQCARAT
jgi:hypothetical protein